MNNSYVNTHKPNGIYELFFKRFLDIFCSLLALILFCWLYGIIAILVKIKLGSPIIYKQIRPGKNEKLFKIYKFRTMKTIYDRNNNLLSDDDRLTKFGRILRSTSLDELPEAINILKGDMSIIGPRPLLTEYLPYYTSKEKHRHDVRPGLSGYAQVNGRNNVDWDTRIQYDIDYVNNINFLWDLKLVLKTLIKAIKRTDINIGINDKVGRLDVARDKKF